MMGVPGHLTSRLELGATDVTGIEIRLPASPRELCRQQ